MAAGDAETAAQRVRRQEKELALTGDKPKERPLLGQNTSTLLAPKSVRRTLFERSYISLGLLLANSNFVYLFHCKKGFEKPTAFD